MNNWDENMKNLLKKFKKKKDFWVDTNPKGDISPEDIFSDVLSPLYDTVNEKKLEVSVNSVRFRLLFVSVFLLFSFFVIYIFYLHKVHGSQYQELAQRNAYEIYEIGPSRGQIISRDGVVLASADTVFNLITNPSKLTNEEIIFVSEKLANLFENFSFEYFFEKLTMAQEKELGGLVLIKNLTEFQIGTLNSLLQEEPKLFLRERSIRDYPFGRVASHVLGYTANITSEELENAEGYGLSDEIGKKGIEYFFEKNLKGLKGVFAKFVTPKGETVKEDLVSPTSRGNDITLTIDSFLQSVSYEALSKSLRENGLTSGAIVIMDVNSGAILSLVSMPDFDPNHFVRGLSDAQARAYFNTGLGPLFNRATSGEYAVGSIIKPFIAAAALQENIIKPRQYILTKGYIEVSSVYDSSVVYRFNDWKNHGAVDMRDAIAVSSNVYFYTIGGGYKDQEGLGIDKIAEYLNMFNWGSPLGINFASEANGLVPTSTWKMDFKDELWSIGDTYNVSIGQGDILATPLQVTSAIAVFANDGKLFRPFIVKDIYSQGDLVTSFEGDIINSNFISPPNLQVVREGMRRAVVSGSSRFLSSLPLEVAGKTGTAQTSGTANNAWFVGFAPYESPQIVVTVLLERGETSDKAVRVAYDIFEAYFTSSIQENE